MIRPTLRAACTFAAGIPIAIVLVLLDERLWPLGGLYIGIVAMLCGVDLVLAPAVRALSIEAKVPPSLFIGEREIVAIDLRNAGPRSSMLEATLDVGANLEPPPTVRAGLEARGEHRLEFPLAALRRGSGAVEQAWLRWQGPLGLMQRRLIVPIAATVPIVPNVRAVREAAFTPAFRDAPFGIKPQGMQGEGSEFEALRAYVAGLDSRSIDWKSSARHLALVCKEFRAERNHQIVLAFDTGHLMSEPLGGIPRLDHAIAAGLLLGYVSLRSGDRVGLFGFDSRVRLYSDPVGGVGNFWRLQQLSARLEYGNDETNFTLGLIDLLTRLHRRSLVVLLTEFIDTVTAELMMENLWRVAARHLIIFVTFRDPDLDAVEGARPATVGDVTRSVIAHDLARERMTVIERLRRRGIHCIDAPRHAVDGALINRYLMIKRQDLI